MTYKTRKHHHHHKQQEQHWRLQIGIVRLFSFAFLLSVITLFTIATPTRAQDTAESNNATSTPSIIENAQIIEDFQLTGYWAAPDCDSPYTIRIYSKHFALERTTIKFMLYPHEGAWKKDGQRYVLSLQQPDAIITGKDHLLDDPYDRLPQIVAYNEQVEWDRQYFEKMLIYQHCKKVNFEKHAIDQEQSLIFALLDRMYEACHDSQLIENQTCQDRYFSIIDVNRDKQLDKPEIFSAIENINFLYHAINQTVLSMIKQKQDAPEKAVAAIFEILDKNKSHTLTLDEIRQNWPELEKTSGGALFLMKVLPIHAMIDGTYAEKFTQCGPIAANNGNNQVNGDRSQTKECSCSVAPETLDNSAVNTSDYSKALNFIDRLLKK